jgi:hypothetical protein
MTNLRPHAVFTLLFIAGAGAATAIRYRFLWPVFVFVILSQLPLRLRGR